MTDPLFELANHSENHRNVRLLDGADVASEIAVPQISFELARRRLAATQCAAKVPEGVASVQTRLAMFRFPFGACNAATLNAVNDAGLLAIQWDVSAGDPDPKQTAAMIADAIVRRTKPGSIIVAHANGRGWHTAEGLPMAIARLKAKGFTFVTVSELLARGKPVVADSCYDMRLGDTDRYDHVAGLRSVAAGQSGGLLPWLKGGDGTAKNRAKGARGRMDGASVRPYSDPGVPRAATPDFIPSTDQH